MAPHVEPIGSRLVAAGLITRDQLDRALARQQRQGGYIGQHLVAAGYLSAGDFQKALARAWNLQRRDLAAQPPVDELLAELDVEEAAELGWLACEITDDKTVIVASCVRPDEGVVAEVLDRFPGMHVEFRACSRGEIDTIALEVRRRRIGRRPQVAPATRVRPIHSALAAAGATLALTAAAVMPVRDLVVGVLLACVAFLLGAALQRTGGFVSVVMAQARDEQSDDAADAERLRDGRPLPLYSVIVRVAGGAAELEDMFVNFHEVDYPRDRTDAILVVAESNGRMLTALRARPPRSWVRVAKVSESDFADVIRACDHALALARGRYVVAYDHDERPAPDQLLRAVAAFEADLIARIDGGSFADPLVGLRVGQRTGPRGRGVLSRLAAVDQVLPVDGAATDRPGPVSSVDVTSVHFNTNLLRRRGGFEGLVRGSGERDPRERPPRVALLDSHSLRGGSPAGVGWVRGRAEGLAQVMVELIGQVARRAGRVRLARGVTARRTGAVAMFLAYPVVLGGAMVELARVRALDASGAAPVAWAVLALTAGFLCCFVVAVAALLWRCRSWQVAMTAVALPAHWLLHAAAAWIAVWSLLVPRRGRVDR